jgi:uncharacterized protein (DUF1330 family)
MPKGYWVSAYRTISDPEKLAAYNKLAGPAVKAAGGRPSPVAVRVVAHDAGIAERTVLIEFDSFEQAVAARECGLPGGAGRTLRRRRARLPHHRRPRLTALSVLGITDVDRAGATAISTQESPSGPSL